MRVQGNAGLLRVLLRFLPQRQLSHRVHPAPSAAQALGPREDLRAFLLAWVPGAHHSLQHPDASTGARMSSALNLNRSTTCPLVALPRVFPPILGGTSASRTTPTVPWSHLGPMTIPKKTSHDTRLSLPCQPFSMMIPLQLLPPSGAAVAVLDRRVWMTLTMIPGTRPRTQPSL